MKICFITDLHIPYHPLAVQNDVLDWALNDALKKQADVIVFAGDFTADGHIDSFRRFDKKIAESNIPVVISPGNSDYRTPETHDLAKAYEKNPTTEILGRKIISLFDGCAKISEDIYALLEKADEKTIVVGHYPPEGLSGEHKARMQKWRKDHPSVPYFFGHLHYFEQRDDFTYLLTPADPDKAIGELPAISYYDTDTNTLVKAYYNCPVPYDFKNYIGLSCRNVTPDLLYAIDKRIAHIELRENVLHTPDDLQTKINLWRQNGGKTLSLHAPNTLSADGQFLEDKWRAFIDVAKRISPDRITLHVPEIQIGDATDERINEIAAFIADKLSELSDNVAIGIENMHMTDGETVQLHRFGYLPEDCKRYIDILRTHTSHQVGMHLDVGHALNNLPFSERYTISTWYAEVGCEINGYHIHQTIIKDGKFDNHNPITSWYGKCISYAGFFRAWLTGILNKAPVFLEIRPAEGYKVSFDLLENQTQVFDLHSHTKYSNCGRDEPETLVDTMVKNGVQLLGITDHNYGIGSRKAEYEQTIRALAQKNADRIRILCGIEIATLPHLFDISSPDEISGYDYCLLEHIDNPESLAKDDLFAFAKKLGIRCGIAHTDMFAYCDIRGYDHYEFFKKLAKAGIFWEMNVSYDSIHKYRQHSYVNDFLNDPQKQAIIRDCKVYISVGFDGHRHEDYDGARVADAIMRLKRAGVLTADKLFDTTPQN